MATTKKTAVKKAGKKAITEFKGTPLPKDIGQIIYIGETNKDNEINVVRINEFKGKKSLDIRRFYEKDGEWAHGKGTSIPTQEVERFLSELEAHAGDILHALGKV